MKFRLAFLVLLMFTLQNVFTRDVRSVFGAFLPSIISSDSVSENSVMEEPEEPPAVPFSVSEKEFTALRIEYIKNQILKKLRLKEKPTSSIDDLPGPLKENDQLLPEADDNFINQYTDDFYGKTTQAIIFPYEDEARCLRKIRVPSACLPFEMPADIHSSDVSTAELWFHKEPDVLDEHNQTYVVSEVAHWDSNKSFQKTKPIAIQETNLREGWIKIDVTYVVKNWLDFQDSPTHALNVACKTCGMDKNSLPMSFKSELKPFLIIYTHSRSRKTMHRRAKRSLTCGPGVNECCRESLYISFADIGWDDWIIKPDGYNAYFCKGSCNTPSALTLSGSYHNSVLRKMMNSDRTKSRPEITPCCAATQFQPLQLVYKVNKTLSTTLLLNMIVESCGCM